jgi:hypothetical protein
VCEKELGPVHANVATSLNNPAMLCQTQGRYAEAELQHKRALAIRKKALGPGFARHALTVIRKIFRRINHRCTPWSTPPTVG